MNAKEQGLPELPEPAETHQRTVAGTPFIVKRYTADQMRAYALAALASRPADTGERGVVLADMLAREMPPGTIISDPRWWAAKIERFLRAKPAGGGVGELVALLRDALPYLREAAEPFEDDGSNEPLELARRIEQSIEAAPTVAPVDRPLLSASGGLDGVTVGSFKKPVTPPESGGQGDCK